MSADVVLFCSVRQVPPASLRARPPDCGSSPCQNVTCQTRSEFTECRRRSPANLAENARRLNSKQPFKRAVVNCAAEARSIRLVCQMGWHGEYASGYVVPRWPPARVSTEREPSRLAADGDSDWRRLTEDFRLPRFTHQMMMAIRMRHSITFGLLELLRPGTGRAPSESFRLRQPEL